MKPWGWFIDASPYKASLAAEREYAAALKGVAREVGKIVNSGKSTFEIKRALLAYAELLEPWARSAAEAMVRRADLKNKTAFAAQSAKLARAVRSELAEGAVAEAYRAKIEENVKLIKSIPVEAAQRVETVAQEALASGERAKAMVAEIMETEGVTESRAMLIAKTETSKASVALTRARATSVGSDGYIWRSSMDARTRPSHKNMEGVFVKWSSPPTLDGMTGHAGEFPNCRCFPEPVLPEAEVAA